jgi:hypothetical protein
LIFYWFVLNLYAPVEYIISSKLVSPIICVGHSTTKIIYRKRLNLFPFHNSGEQSRGQKGSNGRIKGAGRYSPRVRTPERVEDGESAVEPQVDGGGAPAAQELLR